MKLNRENIKDGSKRVLGKLKREKGTENWSTKTAEQKLEAFAFMLDKSILSYRHLIKRSFIAGIFTGLGATVGVTLVFIILAALIAWIGQIPFVGDIIKNSQIQTQLDQLNPKK
jgi:hypothetical protein